jgi:hypothetical protein
MSTIPEFICSAKVGSATAAPVTFTMAHALVTLTEVGGMPTLTVTEVMPQT